MKKTKQLRPDSVHFSLQKRETSAYRLNDVVGKSSMYIRRLELSGKLKGHNGCVNTVTFTPDGRWCLTGSDDCKLMLWDIESHTRKLSFNSGHSDNIFSAKVLPFNNNEQLVSCAADGLVRWANLETKVSKKLMAHSGRAHRLALEPGSSSTFFSCGEDGAVYFYDLRSQTNRRNKLLTLKRPKDDEIIAIYAISVDPFLPTRLIVAGSDPNVFLHDLRKINQRAGCYSPKHLRDSGDHVTGAVFNWCGREMVATYNDELVYRFDVEKNSYDPDEIFVRPSSTPPATETSPLLARESQTRRTRKRVRPESKPWVKSASAERIRREEELMLKASGEEAFFISRADEEVSNSDSSGDYDREHVRCRRYSDFPSEEDYQNQLLPPNNSYLTKYEGHRNAQTVKQVNWFGPRSEYVVSGSDCGHIFIWERESGMLETLLYGDRIGAVNCLESHPSQMVLATSGLEHDAKIWRPTRSEPISLMDLKGRNRMPAEEIMERNAEQRSARGERMEMTSDMLLSLLMGVDAEDDENEDEMGVHSEDEDEERATNQHAFTQRRRRRFRLGAGILQLLSLVGRIPRRRSASDNEEDSDNISHEETKTAETSADEGNQH